MAGKRFGFAALVVLSSAGALMLEIVWTRRMVLVLGSTILATATVLAATMAGLAIGAWLGAWLAPRVRSPARAFALAQWCGALAAGLPLLATEAPTRATWALGMVAVVAASIALGVIFPLAGRVRESDGSGLGGGLGRLVALDVFGALTGTLLGGLIGIPVVGIWRTFLVAVTIKAVIGLFAWVIPARRQPSSPLESGPTARPTWKPMVLVAVTGFSLLGAEALWARLLAYVLYRGSSTYALTNVLACVLAGHALGAWIVSRRVAAGADPETVALSWAKACGAGLLLSLGLLMTVAPVPSRSALGFVDFLVSITACGLPSFFSGGVFAATCLTSDAAGAGRLASVNALGGLIGALGVSLFLVPAIGLGWSLTLLGIAPIIAAVGLRRPSPGAIGTVGWLAPIGIILTGIALPLVGPSWTRHLGPVVFYGEGPQASVAVVEDPPGVRRLYVDGMAVAGTDLALATDQRTLAHLPVLLHGEARSVLTVGFGAGGTSHSLLMHPDLTVDCVEISSTVLAAAPHLDEVNHGLLTRPEPRYRLHTGDARVFLAEAGRTWDIIINDCTDLAYRSDAALYTRDFFELIGRRLNPEGLAAVWLPLRGEPPFLSLRSVIASFNAAFPCTSLWTFDALPIHFGILVGSNQDLELDLEKMGLRLEIPAVRKDLEAVGLHDAARLAASRQLDRKGLIAFSNDVTPHTDDLPVVEFWAPLETGGDASAYAALNAAGRPSAPAHTTGRTMESRSRFARRILVRPWLLAGHRAWADGNPDLARHHYLTALRLAPDDSAVRSLLGLSAEKTRQLLARVEDDPGDARSLASLGAIHLMEGRPLMALEYLDRATALMPDDSGIGLGLGLAQLKALGPDLAAPTLTRVLSGRPPQAIAHGARLGLVQARLGPILGWLLECLTWTGL